MSAVSNLADRREQVAFYWSGHSGRPQAETIGGFVPAVLAPYRDIDGIRHDYPLVLHADSQRAHLDSLTSLVGRALTAIGSSNDAVPWQAARIERAVRRLGSQNPPGLRQAWMLAAEGLAADCDASFLPAARAIADALPDGELVYCDREAPARVIRHLWQAAQVRKSGELQARLERLILGLRALLDADFARSKLGRTPERLKASLGPLYADQFDFEAMSRILSSKSPESLLHPQRRRRIAHTLDALESQGFVPLGGRFFEFDSCVDAQRSYQERLPRAIALARAIAVAELELDGAYRESVHDPLFAEFGAAGLDPRELAFLPSPFVCLDFASLAGAEQIALESTFSAALPFKVFVRIDDLVEPSPTGDGQFSLGARARRLAWSALSDGGIFALQTTSAGLLGACNRIERALDFDGPALLSVYSGATSSLGVPTYLAAAAASESRVFPSFAYDPSAGSDWAARYNLEGNAQPENPWPVRSIQFEDGELQLTTESAPFTAVEFAMIDVRLAGHLSAVPPESWSEAQIPVREALEKPIDPLGSQVPFTLAVDAENRLHRLLVDAGLLGEARRCAEAWRSIQELGGIGNSHAAKLLEAERAALEVRVRNDSQAQPLTAERVAPAESSEAQAPTVPTEPEAPRSDEPYIETPRCTTCNECTNLNPKMFAYNDNKQAYIKDPNAGTYAQLVEAAETCQVSIIHPGKPRNPNEPGLDELIKRAEPFL